MRKSDISTTFLTFCVICAVCSILSNILAVKQFEICVGRFVFPSTAGLLIFPISYIINDCVAEVWGYRRARTVIWLTFAANFFAVGVFQLSVALPPAAHWTMQEAYAGVLAQTPRIAAASLAAFFVGSFTNAFIMSKMKVRQGGRNFAWRAIVSTVFGELFDTAIFTVFAFAGVIPFSVVLGIVATETVLKTLYETAVLPLTNVVIRKVKKWEETDVFDHEISYNPFKIK